MVQLVPGDLPSKHESNLSVILQGSSIDLNEKLNSVPIVAGGLLKGLSPELSDSADEDGLVCLSGGDCISHDRLELVRLLKGVHLNVIIVNLLND